MDEFGVLVESIGFKAHGKSAPLADLKTKTNINSGNSRDFGISSGFNTKPTSVNRSKSVYNPNSINGSFGGDVNGIYQSSNNRKSEDCGAFDGFDDVFGGSIKILKSSSAVGFDLDSIFKVNSSVYHDDDIFGGTPGLKNSTTVSSDDVFGSTASFLKQSAPIEDLFGNFGEISLASNGSREKSGKTEKNAQKFNDLIPGFGGSSTSRNGENAESSWSTLSSGFSSKSTSTSPEDPFVILKQSSSQTYTSSRLFSEPVEQDSEKSPILSSFDELEGFAMGKVQNKAYEQYSHSQKEGAEATTHDLDTFFGLGAKLSSGSMRKSTMVDPLFDSLFQSRGNPGAEQTTTGSSPNRKKAPFTTNIVDDFSFFFPEVAPSSGEFQETEGESEERRRARLNHHMRTQQRMAKALAEKNQRDVQTQWEQEERHRIAETLDDSIKRWAAGKEGNLRALLSSLQYVLWPECGWQQVSLMDLITSVSVKKVYYKATLCVHPDKVQQKGANIKQKYIAEKVFDVLKEAWNKFNAEEL